ncbi:hypothetical protein [Sulfobacillus thermosulfidooxidans]|uniref:hypothetical protein n=1 Tax=Sulfobacillus thermosulfidooxidans TaxID=28034 RepID=UPI0006B4E94E|nr:hypothetical protein [Sulfobacillus thermosulfidooxidans]
MSTLLVCAPSWRCDAQQLTRLAEYFRWWLGRPIRVTIPDTKPRTVHGTLLVCTPDFFVIDGPRYRESFDWWQVWSGRIRVTEPNGALIWHHPASGLSEIL